MRLQALQDLEVNMNRLQGIIETKDEVITGLRDQLNDAMVRIERSGGIRSDLNPR